MKLHPHLHEFALRWKSLFRRRRMEREMAEELEFHQAMLREKLLREGVPQTEVNTMTRRTFGDARRWRERLIELWQFRALENFRRDVSFSARLLKKSPGFTAVALVTLTIAIGATTSIFSLINGLLLRPLPVPHADQLAVVHSDRSDYDAFGYSFCAPFFRALEKRHQAFQDVAAFTNSTMQVRSSSGSVEVPGAIVSGQFFRALETPPLLGRYLTPRDDQPGGGPGGFGVVISESFWRTWFNKAPDVVGQKIIIANAPFTVVGVMPKRFIGADPTHRPEIYVPLWAEPVIDAPYNNIAGGYHAWWLAIIARRNRGVSLEQANAALKTDSNPILEEAIPDAQWIKDAQTHHFEFVAESGSNGFSYLRSRFRKPLVAVFTFCTVMLLLACLNLASLLMARAAARERELATRLAFGATRRRLIQQLLVESLLIAVMGTATGIAVSPILSRSLAALLLGHSHNTFLDTSLDLRMFLFAATIAAVAAVLVGLIPALRATSKNLSDQIKDGSHATSARQRRRLLPRALMGLEVALALMLVVGAGLLATSLVRLYRTGLGFDPKGVVNLELRMDKQSLDGNALLRWYQKFGDSLAHEPGVKSVSFDAVTPLSGSTTTITYHTLSNKRERTLYMNTVAPEYFRTMRIPMLEGRDFRWNDTSASGNKIILNRTAAKMLFPGQNAVGQHVAGWPKGSQLEVIAVVGDVRYASIKKGAPAGAYMPITQSEQKKASYTAVVRIDGPPAPLASAARELAARMAPDIPSPVMTTMSGDLDASISSERMMAMLSVFFAGCALFITAIGLYGTLAYATARRTSEIGIRMALGAQRVQVVGLIFRENAWVAAGGLLAGLVAALLASRALASFLYGTSPRDPWVMTISALALGTVATTASLIPAIRAALIEPITAIRHE
ncbi:MAG TPA: ABC transporter permease [Acidobacteriaceae bacterium]|nr:ABC transporter permease [Acidobacteriaceae bacterium]